VSDTPQAAAAAPARAQWGQLHGRNGNNGRRGGSTEDGLVMSTARPLMP
jgi:hypothetical protein